MMNRYTRGQAIRAKCLDCCCGSYAEVRMCPVPECPLYRYRLGHEEVQPCKRSTDEKETEKREDATEFLAKKEVYSQEAEA